MSLMRGSKKDGVFKLRLFAYYGQEKNFLKNFKKSLDNTVHVCYNSKCQQGKPVGK